MGVHFGWSFFSWLLKLIVRLLKCESHTPDRLERSDFQVDCDSLWSPGQLSHSLPGLLQRCLLSLLKVCAPGSSQSSDDSWLSLFVLFCSVPTTQSDFSPLTQIKWTSRPSGYESLRKAKERLLVMNYVWTHSKWRPQLFIFVFFSPRMFIHK